MQGTNLSALFSFQIKFSKRPSCDSIQAAALFSIEFGIKNAWSSAYCLIGCHNTWLSTPKT
ncbi:hypothetical protein C0J52_01215 [Blattella germanica]|nr:hypothetical protein C0J52_01215 [Blattella germanica]